LEDLRLPDNDIFGDLGLTILAQHNHGLKHINLENCKNISDCAVIEIGINCTKLQYISLDSCIGGVTDLSIISSISKFCSKLTYINLNRTMVTAEGRDSLLKSCKGLRRIHLSHVIVEIYDMIE
jgi:hypothetical protein